MQTIFIKFLTHDDRVRGFYELATRLRIGSLPGEVYQVPLEGLKLLEKQSIGYRRATDAEVKDAHDQVRNPAPSLQSTLFSDQLVRVRVEVDDTSGNWEAMRRLKEALKARFEQIDISITAHRIEIV